MRAGTEVQHEGGHPGRGTPARTHHCVSTRQGALNHSARGSAVLCGSDHLLEPREQNGADEGAPRHKREPRIRRELVDVEAQEVCGLHRCDCIFHLARRQHCEREKIAK